MRRSYYRAIGYLLLVSLWVTLLGCNDSTELANEYYARAIELHQRNQPDLAQVELKNALQSNPTHENALRLQIQLHEESGDVGQLMIGLNSLLAVKPNDFAAGLRKAELLMLSGAMTDASEYLEQALQSEPNNTQAINLKTAWLIQKNDFLAAENYSAKALQNPDITSYSFATVLKIQTGQNAEAAKIVTAGLQKYPDASVLHLLNIRLAEVESRFEEIPELYRKLIDRNPETIDFHWLLAQFFLQSENRELAISTMREAVERYPDNGDAKYFLARILALGGTEESVDGLKQLIEEHGNVVDLRFVLAKLYADNNDLVAARQELGRIAASQQASPQESQLAQAGLARLAIAKGDLDSAEKHAAALLRIDPENTAGLLTLANVNLIRNNPQLTISAVRTVLANEPKNDYALELSGRAYLAVGSRKLARAAFRSAIAANPLNQSTAHQLVAIYQAESNHVELERLLTPFAAAQMHDAFLEFSLLRNYLAQKKWGDASHLARTGVTSKKDPTLITFVEALTLIGKGSPEPALPLLDQLLQSTSANRDVISAVVNALFETSMSKPVLTTLEHALQRTPNEFWLWRLLYDAYKFNGNDQKILSLLNRFEVAPPAAEGEFGWLAAAYFNTGNLPASIAAIDAGLRSFPQSINLLRDKAELLEFNDDPKAAAALYEQILIAAPHEERAANNLAMIYARQPDSIAKARQIAKLLEDTTIANYANTLGWVCLQSKDYPCAIKHLEKALNKEPNNAEFNFHLGVAFYDSKRKDRAAIHLNRCRELLTDEGSFPYRSELTRLLSALEST